MNSKRSGKPKEDRHKLDKELKTLHFQAANLDRKNWNKKQKRDHDWKHFESLGGGSRPKQRQGYVEHLRRTHKRNRLDREDAICERRTGQYDLTRGSAVRRLRQKVQKRRVKVIKRLRYESHHMGNPHVIYTAGRLNKKSQNLELSSRLQRRIGRTQNHQDVILDKVCRDMKRETFSGNFLSGKQSSVYRKKR